MLTIQEILQFHFSPDILKLAAQKIIPATLHSLNDHRIDKLQKITNEVGESAFLFTGNNLIPQVFRKFKDYFKGKNNDFDNRELRTLTYSLSYSEENLHAIFCNENELRHALTLLHSKWKDSLLVGLIDCFLRNWDSKFARSLEELEQFISGKLDDYTGNRSTLISFKSNKRFFNTKNGDLILGDTLAKLDKPIEEATEMLSVPDSWLAYPYFSKVITTHCERSKRKLEDTIDNYYGILQKHNSSVTNKRLISKIIIRADQPEYAVLQDRVKSIAFHLIGDPGNTSVWGAFENATEAEKAELAQARKILNEWITRQFIDVFFKVCINDERRKKFWLQFSSKISSFKVYGPLRTKNILKQDERIAEYIDARFESVQNSKDVSAFILYIGDYMLIEFSNEGYAFYAYKINSRYFPKLNGQLKSVDDLRNSSMPILMTNNSYYYSNDDDEGRLTHKDGNQLWEMKFNDWMNQKVFR